MKRRLTLAAVLLFLGTSGLWAQEENGPTILLESFQSIATKYDLEERLKIDWNNAKVEDIGRYVGFLAATSEVAKSIARKNSRDKPGVYDFEAALAALCAFPPNKPPLVEEYWDKIIPAFYSADVRGKLDKAVGPVAATLPSVLEKSTSLEEVMALFPTSKEEYLKQVLDLTSLDDQ